MKKKLSVVCLAVLMCFSLFIYASNACASQMLEDQYVRMESSGEQGYHSEDLDDLYPINADSPEWAEFITEEEKFENTQIDSAIVKGMDTDTLLEAVLRSPMLHTVEEGAVDREDAAMTFLEKTNAGRELLEREDVKGAILNKYLSLEIPEETLNDYSEIDNPSDGDYNAAIMRLLADEEFSKNLDQDIAPLYRIHFLEGAILSDEIYPKLSVEEKKKLYDKSLVLNKQEEKSEVFSYCADEFFTLSLMEDVALAERLLFPMMRKEVVNETFDLFAPGKKIAETSESHAELWYMTANSN